MPDIAKENLPPYDYIIVTTKNIPDIPPTVASLLKPALPSNNTETTVVLIQNGLNIEKPLIQANPNTPVLSGISLIGSIEKGHGIIVQEEGDRLLIGPFRNPNIEESVELLKAHEFAKLYSAGGKTDCNFSPYVLHDRWRKLAYNACLNPICAITGLDTGRIRLADGAVEGLVRPAMNEIVAAAKANGVELSEGVVDFSIDVDPLDVYLKPSMMADVEKVSIVQRKVPASESIQTFTHQSRVISSSSKTFWVNHCERGWQRECQCRHCSFCIISPERINGRERMRGV